MDYLATATLYAKRLNAETFPVVGKLPAMGYSWGDNALNRAGVHDVTPMAWEAATGFAVAPIRGDSLVIIDCDSPDLLSKMLETIPALQKSFTVRRGDHAHVYARLFAPLEKSRVQLKDGDTELGSIRGAGAYVVGPYSQHESGDTYKPGPGLPIPLSEQETDLLLALFGHKKAGRPAAATPAAPLSIRSDIHAPEWLIKSLIQHFEANGYHRHEDTQRSLIWLNGECPNQAAHPNGDKHPSFGFNSAGMGYCFKCGWMRAVDVARHLGIKRETKRQKQIRTRSERAELIARGFTRAARLIDLLHADKKRFWKRGELLNIGGKVSWSRATVDRNIRQAIDAQLFKRITPGLYEQIHNFETPAPGAPYGSTYSEHPAAYRKALLLRVEKELQPTQPTANNLSSGAIARIAGLSERTLYRYENALKIRKIEVWQRSTISKIDGFYSLPVDHLDENRAATYQRLEVVVPDRGVIRRFELTESPSKAMEAAINVAREYRGVVVLAQRRPSIRILPGQQILEMLPARANIGRDFKRLYIDPIWMDYGQKSLPRPHLQTSSFAPRFGLSFGAKTDAQKINDSNLTARSEKRPINGLILREMFPRTNYKPSISPPVRRE